MPGKSGGGEGGASFFGGGTTPPCLVAGQTLPHDGSPQETVRYCVEGRGYLLPLLKEEGGGGHAIMGGGDAQLDFLGRG